MLAHSTLLTELNRIGKLRQELESRPDIPGALSNVERLYGAQQALMWALAGGGKEGYMKPSVAFRTGAADES